MKYYKQIENGYITAIGTGVGNVEITETKYNEIMDIIQNKPEGTDTLDYRLKEDLTWEAFGVEPTDFAEEELGAEEALEILMGGTA